MSLSTFNLPFRHGDDLKVFDLAHIYTTATKIITTAVDRSLVGAPARPHVVTVETYQDFRARQALNDIRICHVKHPSAERSDRGCASPMFFGGEDVWGNTGRYRPRLPPLSWWRPPEWLLFFAWAFVCVAFVPSWGPPVACTYTDLFLCIGRSSYKYAAGRN